ncbi:uncharacterized protein [Fopius arisanus]|uniref:RNase H type-1 domain-containing protein n=1 Tax=Fopius arisanus TaxID=64838 RepID=A0A9R1TQC5_9HYME|nr:PREDICTED: uncharacterized protein LOC105272869 [Fopius arisanus]
MYKSPGPDGIYPALLQKGGPQLLQRLLPTLRASLALGHVPYKWREVRVVFIPKPGKCSYDNAKSFRPISLSSFLLKTLERLVDRHIKMGAPRTNPISLSQHAYQVGRSTETALHRLVGKIEGAKARKEATLGVFIDIEGAFDNTFFSTMEKAAASFGIEQPIIRWIAAMLRTRTVSSSLGDSTALDHVQRWCTSNGLKVNPGKTEMVLYTDKRKLVVKPPSIYNTVLSFSEDLKYLGLWIDRRLSWKKHINMQTSKVIWTYWACRRMFGSTWGLRPTVVRWISTAIMLPQLTYAAVAWWPAMNKACHRKTVERLGRLAPLGITGALRTTPTSALEALLFMQPPHLIIRDVVLSTAARLKLTGTWSEAKRGHASLLTEDRVLLGSLSKGGDTCRTEWHPHKRFKVNLGTVDTQAWVHSKWSPPHGLVWYTDGSKRCGGAGAGVWSNRPSVEKALGLDPHATPLQTELAALRACARIILARQDKGKVIHIYSDSRWALGALLKHESGSRLVNDCIELMNKVATCNKLKVSWIPGHAGILGNEKADMLAKQGYQTMKPGDEDHVGVHSDYINETIQKRADRGVVERWNSRMGARHTRSLLREPSRKLDDELVSLSRVKLRALLGLITGHWLLAAYLARIGPHHLSTKCSGLDELRLDIFETTCLKDLYVDRDGFKGLYEFARGAQMLTPLD